MNSDTSTCMYNGADAVRIPQLDAGGPAAAAFAEGASSSRRPRTSAGYEHAAFRPQTTLYRRSIAPPGP